METELVNQIRQALDKLGIPNWRMQSGMVKVGHHFVHLHKAGTADILILPPIAQHFSAFTVCHPVWLETKWDRGSARMSQLVFKERVEGWGHTYLIIRSLDDLIPHLAKWK